MRAMSDGEMNPGGTGGMGKSQPSGEIEVVDVSAKSTAEELIRARRAFGEGQIVRLVGGTPGRVSKMLGVVVI